jgi:hypothetical protein
VTMIEDRGDGVLWAALDPQDSFHVAIIEILKIHGKKGADYALDTDQYSNFRDVASMMSEQASKQPWLAADFLEMVKLARLKSLRTNNREPMNESVLDTYMDKATYAVLAYAIVLQTTREGLR